MASRDCRGVAISAQLANQGPFQASQRARVPDAAPILPRRSLHLVGRTGLLLSGFHLTRVRRAADTPVARRVAVVAAGFSQLLGWGRRPRRRVRTRRQTGGGAWGRITSNVSQRLSILTWSLGVVWLALFCDYVLMTMAIPIFPLLGMSPVATGYLFSAKAACQILFSPFLARFVNRHEKRMILGGLTSQGLSILVFAMSFDYKLWLFARAASGISSAAIVSAGLAHLKRRYSDQQERAVAMGLATTGIVGGVCFGPVLGGLLYEASPQLPFALLAGLVSATAVLAARYLPTFGADVAAEREDVPVSSMLRRPEAYLPLGALVVANAGISCLESTVARHLSVNFGLAVASVGSFFLLVSAPSCLLSALAGPIGNRIGQGALVRAGLLVQGLFTCLGPKSSLGANVVSMLGLGAGMGMIDGAAPALLGAVADKHFKGSGKIFILSNMAVQLGFVVGPVLGNVMVEACGFGGCCVASGSLLVVYAALLRGRAGAAAA